MRKATTALLAFATGLFSTGCATGTGGTAVPAIDISSSLPFTPTISERVNGRNDGSTFEPCISYSARELSTLDIDPGSIKDAGFSDSPNFRGCAWTSPDRQTRFHQILGDEVSLANYKRKQSQLPWQPDRIASGREIAVAPDSPDACVAAFMSQDAIVVTGVIVSTAKKPSPGLQEECDKAFAFASLAASKAP
ncbi:hypothetical protein GCM10009551_061440 [Nocardiopsis tropica]|uniref:DUF3558 family protein n=1 Tax=Tsukamurella strandjordii TaxID=147577 RepID=UPI0031CE1C95